MRRGDSFAPMKGDWVAIGLGSNLGNKAQELKGALNFLRGLLLQSRWSKVYESDPWGFSSENHFWNMVVIGRSHHKPEALLERLLQYENQQGRLRSAAGYSDRTIDLDLIFFGNVRMSSAKLQLPHPHWKSRSFVVAPLLELKAEEIWPDLALVRVEGHGLKEVLKFD